jgi:hypothetical protein
MTRPLHSRWLGWFAVWFALRFTVRFTLRFTGPLCRWAGFWLGGAGFGRCVVFDISMSVGDL